jgi:hypothetical protein
MTALDVISLTDAKNWLNIDLSDTSQDVHITRLIKTAIAWVEKYTDYALYERDVVIPLLSCNYGIATYPISITGVVNGAVDQEYTTQQKSLEVKVLCSTWNGSSVNVTIGYADVTDIPQPLIDGAYKWITYLFQNKDIYEMVLPYDVQVLINQYRRSATL